jgi:Ca2+-binding RTX toxin-like protein
MDGGAGRDTVSWYKNYDAAVVADLAAGTGVSAGETDRFSGMENMEGSYHDDVLLGDGLANVIDGVFGDDRLDGRGGADTLIGKIGDDELAGGGGDDSLHGGAGDDTAAFAGRRADYRVERGAGSSWTVEDLRPSAAGDDGSDVVAFVEHLRFADVVVDLT